jgi:serine/threonine-protein kinase
MSLSLLGSASTDLPPIDFLRSLGVVFAEFSRTQDSGNISYGVRIGDDRYFVKTAGNLEDKPYLDHAERTALLRHAIRFYGNVSHPIVPPLLHVTESAHGPMLVYPWCDGELLGVSRAERDDPASSFQRFRALPIETIIRCLSSLYDFHARIARDGWIAGDFYDGCLLYDFDAGRLHLIDLDMYQDAPFTNTMGRMFGSDRFMAPEEYELGAPIDERTTVFTMGRTALVFLSDGTLSPEAFRGLRELFEVVARACEPDRERRWKTMGAYWEVWSSVLNYDSSD